MSGHVVASIGFEYDCPSQEVAAICTPRISDFAQDRLRPLLDRAFAQAGYAANALTLDAATLDLGDLRLSHLEDDLERAVRRALSAALARARVGAEAGGGGARLRRHDPLATLAAYCAAGAPRRAGLVAPDRLLRDALAAGGDGFAPLFRTLWRRPDARRRLTALIDETFLRRIVMRLSPRSGAVITAIADTARRALSRTGGERRDGLTLAALSLAVADGGAGRGAAAQADMLSDGFIHAYAGAVGARPDQIAQIIAVRLAHIDEPSARARDLTRRLRAAAERLAALSPPPDGEDKAAPAHLDGGRGRAKMGSPAWLLSLIGPPVAFSHRDASEIDSAFERSLASAPDELRGALRRAAARPSGAQRIVSVIGADVLAASLRRFAGPEHPLIELATRLVKARPPALSDAAREAALAALLQLALDPQGAEDDEAAAQAEILLRVRFVHAGAEAELSRFLSNAPPHTAPPFTDETDEALVAAYLLRGQTPPATGAAPGARSALQAMVTRMVDRDAGGFVAAVAALALPPDAAPRILALTPPHVRRRIVAARPGPVSAAHSRLSPLMKMLDRLVPPARWADAADQAACVAALTTEKDADTLLADIFEIIARERAAGVAETLTHALRTLPPASTWRGEIAALLSDEVAPRAAAAGPDAWPEARQPHSAIVEDDAPSRPARGDRPAGDEGDEAHSASASQQPAARGAADLAASAPAAVARRALGEAVADERTGPQTPSARSAKGDEHIRSDTASPVNDAAISPDDPRARSANAREEEQRVGSEAASPVKGSPDALDIPSRGRTDPQTDERRSGASGGPLTAEAKPGTDDNRSSPNTPPSPRVNHPTSGRRLASEPVSPIDRARPAPEGPPMGKAYAEAGVGRSVVEPGHRSDDGPPRPGAETWFDAEAWFNGRAPFAPKKAYDDAAGLILLWPFLGPYFENLGLVEDGAFASPRAAEAAVGLCAWLATGEPLARGAEPPLAKRLCGLSPGHAVIDPPPPDEDARALGLSLLTAVTRHWTVVENNGVDGLRETFLARGGVLRFADPASGAEAPDELDMEQRAFDMLLRSLPWPLEIVRLPWMARPVKVNWL